MTATLFDLAAMTSEHPARRSDPQTSRDGAVMTHLPAQRLAVLTALVAIGDCTPWAIVERLAGPESGTVRSRLSQLEHTGLAVKVGTALVKIVADDVAVSLRRATAQVQRNERRTADDGPPPQRPAPSYSEEPF